MFKRKKILLTSSMIILPIATITTTISCAKHQNDAKGYIADYIEEIKNIYKEILELIKEYLKNIGAKNEK